jgi:hypothetical protein
LGASGRGGAVAGGAGWAAMATAAKEAARPAPQSEARNKFDLFMKFSLDVRRGSAPKPQKAPSEGNGSIGLSAVDMVRGAATAFHLAP